MLSIVCSLNVEWSRITEDDIYSHPTAAAHAGRRKVDPTHTQRALSKQPMCRTGRYEGSHDQKETPPHPGHRQVKRGVHIKVWFLLSQLKEPPPVPQEPSESVWEASHCGPEFVAWEPAPAFFSFFFSSSSGSGQRLPGSCRCRQVTLWIRRMPCRCSPWMLSLPANEPPSTRCCHRLDRTIAMGTPL